MFRRIEPIGRPHETFEGKMVQHYGPVDLPSDGQIKSYLGVIKGLCNRKALSEEEARKYRRVLLAKPPKRDLQACKHMIQALNMLLEKSPSPKRDRDRSRGHRRYGIKSHRDSDRHFG